MQTGSCPLLICWIINFVSQNTIHPVFFTYLLSSLNVSCICCWIYSSSAVRFCKNDCISASCSAIPLACGRVEGALYKTECWNIGNTFCSLSTFLLRAATSLSHMLCVTPSGMWEGLSYSDMMSPGCEIWAIKKERWSWPRLYPLSPTLIRCPLVYDIKWSITCSVDILILASDVF